MAKRKPPSIEARCMKLGEQSVNLAEDCRKLTQTIADHAPQSVALSRWSAVTLAHKLAAIALLGGAADKDQREAAIRHYMRLMDDLDAQEKTGQAVNGVLKERFN